MNRTALLLPLFLIPAPLAAQSADSAAFIIRLGTDTTAVERYVRTDRALHAEAVSRSPSTMLHRLSMTFGEDGRVTGAVYTQHRPGTDAELRRVVVSFTGDSARMETVMGSNSRTQTVAAANAIPLAGPFYAPYELAMMRAVSGNQASLRVPLLAGSDTVGIPVARLGADSVTLTNQFGEPMRAHIDARGRLLHLNTPAFTTVERLDWVDLDALARDFAARDHTGGGLGMLSPRAAYRTVVDGANVWVDYSRPGMRGRPIWGALVPWGAVWRMGANDAAHIAVDRTVELGGVVLEPGTYTLFLIPDEDAWTLIVNRATDISGLAHDASHDVGRAVMRVETMPQAAEQFTIRVEDTDDAGVLWLQWDRTRASVPLRVR